MIMIILKRIFNPQKRRSWTLSKVLFKRLKIRIWILISENQSIYPIFFIMMRAPLYEIDAEIANGKTKIVAWDAKDIRVECNAKVYRAENQVKAREIFLKNVLFTIKDGKCKFYIQDKGMKVDVVIYVPKKEYENIQVRMFNGGITAEALRG